MWGPLSLPPEGINCVTEICTVFCQILLCPAREECSLLSVCEGRVWSWIPFALSVTLVSRGPRDLCSHRSCVGPARSSDRFITPERESLLSPMCVMLRGTGRWGGVLGGVTESPGISYPSSSALRRDPPCSPPSRRELRWLGETSLCPPTLFMLL